MKARASRADTRAPQTPAHAPFKTSPPRLVQVYERKRLFKALDQARRQPVVWLAGPGGAGKTTLVASYLQRRKLPCLWYQIDAGDADIASFFYYMGIGARPFAPRQRRPLPLLTAEYRAGLPAFSRNYFRELFARLRRPTVIVLDNYQEVPADAPLHEALQAALAEIPGHVNVVVISRTDPPPAFARLRATRALVTLGWDQLRLVPEETLAIGRLRSGRTRLAPGTAERLHAEAGGWVTGLVLLLEHARDTRDVAAHGAPHGAAHDLIFDYFAGEVLERTDEETRLFLIKTAFLPKFTLAQATALTGSARAEAILTGLTRRNYFTLKHAGHTRTYEYHPLFRAFLRERARGSLTPSALRELKCKAGRVLMQSGEAEAAIDLLRETEAWDELRTLVLAQARSLLEQGRTQTLTDWLASLPPAEHDTSPWLCYWDGTCRLAFAPAESRRHFERAYALFEAEGSHVGMLLAACSVVDTCVYEWGDFRPLDRWIAILERLIEATQAAMPPEIAPRVASAMFTALMYRQPDHPRLPYWDEQVRNLVVTSPDVRTRMLLGNQLALYYTWWTGDLAKATLVTNAIRPLAHASHISALALVSERSIVAAYHWFTASYEECLDAVSEGLRIARDTGVHLKDFLLLAQGVIGALTAGELGRAEAFLREAQAAMDPTRGMDVAHYHFLAFMNAFFRKDTNNAVTYARQAVTLADAVGVPFGAAVYRIGLAHALFMQGDRAGAYRVLAQARRIGKQINSINVEFGVQCAAVVFALDNGKRGLAVRLLRRTLALGREHGFANRPLWTPEIMTKLFVTALEHGIEVEYVHSLIHKRKLVPTAAPIQLDNWPWPVRIYTLGRFAIVRDGVAQRSSGKGQRKPLELLKAIIALGGRDIGLHKLTDAVWPDAEYDDALRSLNTTLHRLRKLLGNDRIIQMHDNRLSLDARCVWVDAWAFERLIGGAGAETDVAAAADKVMGLYRGGFLDEETQAPWSLSVRERLRSKFFRFVLASGRYWEGRGEHERAIACYLRGLEVDNLAEELYRRLMTCYRDLGQPSEALAVYRRCRHALTTLLGIAPSPETQSLYQTLNTRT